MRKSALLLLALSVVACRSRFDNGPLQPGDTALATEPIAPILFPDDGEPPPPPIDTLSEMRIGGVSAELTDLIVRVRYYLDQKGTRGWVDFPTDNQPPGVRVDSAARIIIHGQKIGGTGTLQISDSAGVVDIDLSQIGGEGTVIAGRCRKEDRSAGGACATITFKQVRWAPTGGQPTTTTASLDVGVPRPPR
jgi:hypothetical protein